MYKKTRFWTLVFFSLSIGLLYFWQDTAEAARLGGSRSFGSRPRYQRSAPPPSQSTTASQPAAGQTAGSQSTAGAAASPMAGRGGMLGGLLMGGLIGSMLFGGGFAGPGLMDLLLVGGGLFLLMRFLRARRMAAESSPAGGASAFERGPAQAWGSAGYSPSAESATAAVQPPALPPGFDAQEFLQGANAIYVRLQSAWDRRDLEDIRQFTSSEVFTEIYHQAQEDPQPGKTELLLINPRILEVRDAGSQTVVSVLYDVMLRENEAGVSRQVRELWHFSRERDKPESFWVLEGIQQVE